MAKLKAIALHQVQLERFSAGSGQNHQFSQLKDRVYSAYAKTVVHILAMTRINPADHSQILTVLLKSAEKDYDTIEKVWTFNYANDVVELYSAEEDAYFTAQNKPLFTAGKLIPCTAHKVSELVALTPLLATDLEMVAALPSAAFVERVDAITALATLERIRRILTPEHSQMKHDSLRKRMEALA